MIIKDSKYKSNFCAQFREIELLDTEPIYIEIIFFSDQKDFLDLKKVSSPKIFSRP